MDSSYYTISQPGHGEYEEKKSRFLGEALPVRSEEEVRAELTRIRKQYYDARHHCYAYVLKPSPDAAGEGDKGAGDMAAGAGGAGMEIRRSSDDGEPSGTAGAPILSVIDGKNCGNVLIVVTRYFGGTLLGTGGLVRAYTKAASLALENAGIACMQEGVVLHLCLPYSMYDRILYQLRQRGIAPERPGFAAEVSFDITVPAASCESVQQELLAVGAGQLRMEEVRRGYFCFSMDDPGV